MDLIDAARKGREAAFLQLFEEHHLPLYRFAYRLTGSVSDAEDVVQECFMELLRPACSYDPGRTSLRTYLFGVVRNQSLKRRRRSVAVPWRRGWNRGLKDHPKARSCTPNSKAWSPAP